MVEKERNLKLAIKGRLTASETRMRQDAATIERLRKERDGLLQTVQRLHSDRNTAHGECDVVCQERDDAQ
jgi:hypothetical protein